MSSFTAQAIAAFFAFTGITYSFAPQVLAQEIPKAQCLSAYGETKCGYNCVSAYGEIKCAEWPGGNCKSSYGEIVCGPPAPANWLNYYGRGNFSSSGIRGAWAVKLERWSGVLRMNGSEGNLVLVSDSNEISEERIILRQAPRGGYILEGEMIASYNLKNNYSATKLLVESFSRNFTTKNCGDRRNCSKATLTQIGN